MAAAAAAAAANTPASHSPYLGPDGDLQAEHTATVRAGVRDPSVSGPERV